MTLRLDDDAICTLQDFLDTNTKEKDVNHIDNDDAEMVCALRPGEVTYIGVTKIERID
jgi:hypothetical protein